MKAYRLHAVNDLRYDDIDIPQLPDDSWCILKVHAAGICSSDIPRVFTKGTYHFQQYPVMNSQVRFMLLEMISINRL